MDIKELLVYSVKKHASDLHLSAGMPPMVRIDGDLCLLNLPTLEHSEVVNIIYQLLDARHKQEFESCLEVDFSFEIENVARFRVNIFQQLRGAAAVFRIIPSEILTLNHLNLPPVFVEIANFSKGLVLVTGPTGSGKSTTVAAMIDYINFSFSKHILTIEDPIEFIHQSKKGLVNQREVYKNTHSFNAALRSALREDPDVIVVGELRDQETIRLAMTAAETGHLVLATLHTNSAPKTINRIIDVFPVEGQSMIRSMLSESLQAVIAQNLVKKNGGGRIAALEIMVVTGAIRNLIRENKTAQMFSSIQTGQTKGMQTMDQHLVKLVNLNIITPQVAYEIAIDKNLFLDQIINET